MRGKSSMRNGLVQGPSYPTPQKVADTIMVASKGSPAMSHAFVAELVLLKTLHSLRIAWTDRFNIGYFVEYPNSPTYAAEMLTLPLNPIYNKPLPCTPQMISGPVPVFGTRHLALCPKSRTSRVRDMMNSGPQSGSLPPLPPPSCAKAAQGVVHREVRTLARSINAPIALQPSAIRRNKVDKMILTPLFWLATLGYTVAQTENSGAYQNVAYFVNWYVN